MEYSVYIEFPFLLTLVEAQILCDRICLMDQGKIIALDTPKNLINSLSADKTIEFRVPDFETMEKERQDKLRSFLSSVLFVTNVEERKGGFVLYTDDLQGSLTDLIPKADENGLNLEDLSTRTATLEDVFIQMTGRSLRES